MNQTPDGNLETGYSNFIKGWEKFCLVHLKKTGLESIFEKTKSVPGFAQAYSSWQKASAEAFGRHGGGDYLRLTFGRPTDAKKLFFWTLENRKHSEKSEVLKEYALTLIQTKAIEGDVGFFRKLGTLLEDSADKKLGVTSDFVILQNWIYGFLWLMSDNVACKHLELSLKYSMSPDAYKKSRQRLKLTRWNTENKNPRIADVKAPWQFTFAEEGGDKAGLEVVPPC